MNELKIFEYENFEVEVITLNGELYFNPYHIGAILGMADRTVRDHIQNMSEKQAVLLRNSDGALTAIRKLNNAGEKFLTESGVYKLVFKSRKPEAEKFTDWIAEEVLPSIRQTGSYSLAPKLPQTYIEALETLLSSEKEKERLTLENKALKPKAEYFDALVDKNLLTNFRDTAKELHIGQKEFIEWLKNNGFIYRNKRGDINPYMPHVQNGIFELKEWQNDYKTDIQTLITPRGRETFRIMLSQVAFS